jgi:uncharacterized membrane protein YfcA
MLRAMLYASLLLAACLTSILSGILGMAGGMILMAILALTLPVAAAMMLHGAVQLTANGSRAWFLRSHVQWNVLPWYAVGAGLVLVTFVALIVVPDEGLILLLIGLLSLGGRFSGSFAKLDITRPLTAVSCGVIVTAAQLLAGASGPVLDVFYLHSPLSRHAIVANKAVTQAFGHLLKIGYYGTLAGAAIDLPGWFFLACMLMAVIGTRVGTRLLDRLDDSRFRIWSAHAITVIAVVCVIEGIRKLVF